MESNGSDGRSSLAGKDIESTSRGRDEELLTNVWERGEATNHIRRGAIHQEATNPPGATSQSSSSLSSPIQQKQISSSAVLMRMKGKSYDSDDNLFDPFSRDMMEVMEKCNVLQETLTDRDATIASLQLRQRYDKFSLNSNSIDRTVDSDSRCFAKPMEERDATSHNAKLIQRLQNQLMREVIYCTKLEAFSENARNDMILAQNKIDTLAEEVYSLREVLLQGRETGLSLEQTKDKAVEAIKNMHSPLQSPPMSSKRCTEECMDASRLLVEQQERIERLQEDKSMLEVEVNGALEECKNLKQHAKEANDSKVSKTTELTNELMELRFESISDKEEINRLNTKCTEEDKARSDAAVVAKELTKELMDYKKRLGEVEEESKAKSDQMYIQKKAIDRLEVEMNQANEEKAQSIQQLEGELQSLQSDNAAKNELLTKRNEELEVLQAELRIRMADVERLTAGLSFSSGEVRKFSEEIENLKLLVTTKESELSLARHELSELIEKGINEDKIKSEDNVQIESDVDALDELKITVCQRDTELVRLNEQFDEVQNELKASHIEKETLIQEAIQLKKSLDESMKEQGDLKADAMAALEKLKKSKLSVKEMESKVQDLNQLEDLNKTLQTENDKLNSKIEKLLVPVSINATSQTEESQEIKSLKEQLEISSEENNALNLKVDVLQIDIDALNQVVQDREAELLQNSAELSKMLSNTKKIEEALDEDRDVLNSSVLSVDDSFEFEVIKQNLSECKRTVVSLNEQLADKDNELDVKNKEIEQLKSQLLDMKIDSIQLRSPSRNSIEQIKSASRAESKSTSINDEEETSTAKCSALLEAEEREKEANEQVMSLQADLDVLKKAFDENMQNAQAGSPMAQQDKILRLEESIESRNEEIHNLKMRDESLQRALSQMKESYARLAKFKTDLHGKVSSSSSSTKKKYSEEEHVFLTIVFLECREMLDAVESVFDSEVASMYKYVESMKTIPDPDGEFLQIKYDGLMNEISTMLAALASTKESIIKYGEYIQQKILDSGPNSP